MSCPLPFTMVKGAVGWNNAVGLEAARVSPPGRHLAVLLILFCGVIVDGREGKGSVLAHEHAFALVDIRVLLPNYGGTGMPVCAMRGGEEAASA